MDQQWNVKLKEVITVSEFKTLDDLLSYVNVQLDLPCERIGNWLWCDCISASKAKTLEKLGFKYSKSKMMYWYTTQKLYRRSPYRNIDEIRAKYGNKLVTK